MSKMSPSTKLFAILGVILIAYVAYQDFAPAPPAPAHHNMLSSDMASADGILPEDLDAHFNRYIGGSRDPFLPTIFPPNSGGQGDLTGVGKHGSWTLTGINQVNGQSSALVEDDSTGDSVFLQVGDRWNGLRVMAIEDESVRFENAFGQQTELSFPQPPADTSDTDTTNGQSSSVPGLSQISPLPGLSPNGAPGGFGSGSASGTNGSGDNGGGQFGPPNGGFGGPPN